MSDWRPIETAPHNTDVLVLTQEGTIDVANDRYEPDQYVKDARGNLNFWPARTSWTHPHSGGYEWDWDLDMETIVGWQPLPSNESPLRVVIEQEPPQ